MHEDRPVVLFAGGGTGGHLYPALALADGLRALRPDVRAVFVGARQGVEARVLPGRGEEHHLLPVRGFARGTSPVAKLAVLPDLARSLLVTAELVHRLKPELVVVTGGYAGAPAGLVAALTGVPLALQEQNSVPGMVIRRLASFARRIDLAFPEARDWLPGRARLRARVTGNPIRPPVETDPGEARRGFGLDPEVPVVLVVGGSQGSAALNRGMLSALRHGRDEGAAPALQVLWSTGPDHLDEVRAGLEVMGSPGWVHAVGYLDDMPAALAAATVAVSRAGAMATSEFLAVGLPALLVPLPTAAANHQAHNARALAQAGAALHLPEAQLTGEGLWETLTTLLADAPRLDTMSAAARQRGRPEAARRIARGLAGFLSPPRGGRT